MANVAKRDIRKWRVRNRIHGTLERPRLCVVATLSHVYAQLINDETGTTLAVASTLSKELASKQKGQNKTEKAKGVGELIAKNAKVKGIAKVIFDRGSKLFHGRVRALAQSARKEGLIF